MLMWVVIVKSYCYLRLRSFEKQKLNLGRYFSFCVSGLLKTRSEREIERF